MMMSLRFSSLQKKAKDLFFIFPNLCICCILKCIKYFFESHNVTRSPFHCLPYNSISLHNCRPTNLKNSEQNHTNCIQIHS